MASNVAHVAIGHKIPSRDFYLLRHSPFKLELNDFIAFNLHLATGDHLFLFPQFFHSVQTDLN